MTIYLDVGIGYLHRSNIYKKYLLMYVSLSYCICYKISAYTYMVGIFSKYTYQGMSLYPAVFVAKYLPIHSSVSDCICLYFFHKYIHIHADPAGRDNRVFIPNHRGPEAESWPMRGAG
jgi:hypothetical protein